MSIVNQWQLGELLGDNDQLAFAISKLLRDEADAQKARAYRLLPEPGRGKYSSFTRDAESARNAYATGETLAQLADDFWALPKNRVDAARTDIKRRTVITFSPVPDFKHEWKVTTQQWQRANASEKDSYYDRVRTFLPYGANKADWERLPDKVKLESRTGHTVFANGTPIGAIFKNAHSTKWDFVLTGATNPPRSPGHNTGTGRQAAADYVFDTLFADFEHALKAILGRAKPPATEAVNDDAA